MQYLDDPHFASMNRSTIQRWSTLLISTGFLLVTTPAVGYVLEGRVVAISDGDTLTVLDGQKSLHKIRLAGIDAPEKKQPFGHLSKQHLSSLVFGKTVIVEWGKVDRFGRKIGKIKSQNTDICLEQIRSGMAWHFKKYAREQSAADAKLYSDAEVFARHKKIGLWSHANPVPPWEWRDRTKGNLIKDSLGFAP